jgi:hypothetical protein
MNGSDHTDKAKHDQPKQRSLEAIDVRLACHEKISRIILVVVLIVGGLTLALLTAHLIDRSN